MSDLPNPSFEGHEQPLNSSAPSLTRSEFHPSIYGGKIAYGVTTAGRRVPTLHLRDLDGRHDRTLTTINPGVAPAEARLVRVDYDGAAVTWQDSRSVYACDGNAIGTGGGLPEATTIHVKRMANSRPRSVATACGPEDRVIGSPSLSAAGLTYLDDGSIFTVKLASSSKTARVLPLVPGSRVAEIARQGTTLVLLCGKPDGSADIVRAQTSDLRVP